MERRYAMLDGTPVTVEDYGGTGAPIVLVHGLAGSALSWALVGDALAGSGRVLALDLPGHGRSGPLPRHDLANHVQAVTSLITAYGLGAVTLVGNSMGGLVASLLAAQRPDLVTSLVLLAPAAPPPQPVVPADPALAARLAIQSLPGIGPLATAALTGRRSPRRQVEDFLDLVMTHPERLPSDAFERAVELAAVRRTMPWAARAFSESAASIRHLLTRRRTYERMLDRIRVPTTLIHGAEDRVVPPAAHRWLARRQSGWRSIELPDVGHTPMLERPDLVVREIDRISRTHPAHVR